MIKMNQMFITEKVFTRITDKPKPITPEDLEGTIDITVNVGVVAGSKTQQLQNMQLLLQMYPQLLQAGICDVSHIAYAMGRIVESMGYKNVSDFVFPAEILKEAQMQGISPQMLMMMKFQEETGQTPPALKQQMDQQIASGMQSAAQQAGIYDRQAAEDVGQAPENQETDLSKQQYIQRIAPQPNASDPDRRDGVF